MLALICTQGLTGGEYVQSDNYTSRAKCVFIAFITFLGIQPQREVFLKMHRDSKDERINIIKRFVLSKRNTVLEQYDIGRFKNISTLTQSMLHVPTGLAVNLRKLLSVLLGVGLLNGDYQILNILKDPGYIFIYTYNRQAIGFILNSQYMDTDEYVVNSAYVTNRDAEEEIGHAFCIKRIGNTDRWIVYYGQRGFRAEERTLGITDIQKFNIYSVLFMAPSNKRRIFSKGYPELKGYLKYVPSSSYYRKMNSRLINPQDEQGPVVFPVTGTAQNISSYWVNLQGASVSRDRIKTILKIKEPDKIYSTPVSQLEKQKIDPQDAVIGKSYIVELTDGTLDLLLLRDIPNPKYKVTPDKKSYIVTENNLKFGSI